MHVGTKVKAPDGTETRILRTRVISELQPEPGESVIYKTRYSGFYETEQSCMLWESGLQRAFENLDKHLNLFCQQKKLAA